MPPGLARSGALLQDALIRCVISLTSDEPPTSIHRVRLLTSQTSVGVVLGKKGQTVTQLRAETGAVIKVLPADGLSSECGALLVWVLLRWLELREGWVLGLEGGPSRSARRRPLQ